MIENKGRDVIGIFIEEILLSGWYLKNFNLITHLVIKETPCKAVIRYHLKYPFNKNLVQLNTKQVINKHMDVKREVQIIIGTNSLRKG